MDKRKTTNIMAGILIILFMGIFLVISGRFIYIQTTGEVNDVSLRNWAKEQRTSSHPLSAKRGTIFDSNDMSLAYDQPTYRLFAVIDETFSKNSSKPQHVVDPDKTAEELANVIDQDKTNLLEVLKSGIENEKKQVEFGVSGKELTQQTKEDIEDLKLPGINFTKEAMRYYPNGVFASHIIGFARDVETEDKEGNIINEISGMTGIEDEKNDVLKGTDGYISFERDKFNEKLLDPNEVIKKPKDGNDVYLTIDQKIQTLLEDVMSQIEEEYSPERMTAIVMNAKTGEVEAMGNRPSYNPNNPTNVKNWYNDAISIPFEPGSTMKMFTWAAAIEDGVYDGQELFKSGSYRINEQVQPVNDHNGGEGWGSITFDEGFQRSSNVAASRLLWDKMDADSYLDYLHAFDFDKKTEIDLPGESVGSISYNYPRDKLSTTFGQGTTLTPIQQVKAATAITNKGKMLKPYVIKKIVDSTTNEPIEENKPSIVGEPISEATSSQMLDLLGSVVNSKHGTGKKFALDNYSTAGKTGTAQIPHPDGGYLKGSGNNIFSFLGMAPKDDPQLIMYVSVQQPDLEKEDGYEQGSVPVSFVFKNVMENSLRYLDIEPDKENESKTKTISIESFENKSIKQVKQELIDKNMKVNVIGSGKKIVSSNVNEGEELLPNQRVLLVTDKIEMPNIKGWSLRDVLSLADLVNIDVNVKGNGFVISQSIKPDKKLKENDKLTIELKPPAELDKPEQKTEE